jgi:hypothetical protein
MTESGNCFPHVEEIRLPLRVVAGTPFVRFSLNVSHAGQMFLTEVATVRKTIAQRKHQIEERGQLIPKFIGTNSAMFRQGGFDKK